MEGNFVHAFPRPIDSQTSNRTQETEFFVYLLSHDRTLTNSTRVIVKIDRNKWHATKMWTRCDQYAVLEGAPTVHTKRADELRNTLYTANCWLTTWWDIDCSDRTGHLMTVVIGDPHSTHSAVEWLKMRRNRRHKFAAFYKTESNHTIFTNYWNHNR